MVGRPEFFLKGGMVTDTAKSAGPTKKVQKAVRGFKLFEPKDGTTRWVQPIEELPFKVHIRFLSDEEQAQIFDKHRVYPGSPKNTTEKLNRIAEDMIELKVIAWERPDTIFPGEAQDYPCEGLNKQRLAKVFLKRDGEDDATNLWRLIVAAEDKALEDETKN